MPFSTPKLIALPRIGIRSTHPGSLNFSKSTALPVELALSVSHILSQNHDLPNRLARYLLGLVSPIVRGNSWFVRVSLPTALRLSQCGQKVLCLYDSVTAED